MLHIGFSTSLPFLETLFIPQGLFINLLIGPGVGGGQHHIKCLLQSGILCFEGSALFGNIVNFQHCCLIKLNLI